MPLYLVGYRNYKEAHERIGRWFEATNDEDALEEVRREERNLDESERDVFRHLWLFRLGDQGTVYIVDAIFVRRDLSQKEELSLYVQAGRRAAEQR